MRRRSPSLVALLAVALGSACTAQTGTAPATLQTPPATSAVVRTAARSPEAPARTTSPPAPPYLATVRRGLRAGVDSVTVVPTEAGRRAPDAELVWKELVGAHPELDSPSLHEQLICHVLFAPTKKVWHLEPGRSAVGLAATIAARCNPGGEPDPDLE